MKKILITVIALFIPSIVFAQVVLYPNRGGTGTVSVPTIGQVLVGQANGTYAPQATSTLGVSATCSNCVATNTGDWAGTWQTHAPNYFQTAGSYLTNLLGGLNALLGNSTTTNLAVTGSGTSTFSGGIVSPCFATSTAGGCITGAGGGSGTNYWTSSGSNLYNNTGTNVGINTTNPSQSLEVQGSILASSTGTALDIISRAKNTNFAGTQIMTNSAAQWTFGTRNDSTETYHFYRDALSTDVGSISTSGIWTLPTVSMTDATTSNSLGMGTYTQSLHAAGVYQDTQSTNTATEQRLLSNFTSSSTGAESTRSVVVDCSGQNAFNNQNFFDTSLDYYPNSNAMYAGLADVASGNCPTLPFELQVRGAGQNIQQSVTMAALPSGSVGFINNTSGTSSIPVSAKVYIASSTAVQELEVDSSPGTTNSVGTPVLSVLQNGKIGMGTSTPADALTLAVGNNAGISVQSSNSAFIGVGNYSAGRWRIQNDFTQGGQLEFLYNNNTGGPPGTTAMTIVGNGSAAGLTAGNVGIGSTSPTRLLTVAGGTILNTEYTVSTSSTMTISWASSTQQLIKLGHAAVTINMSNYAPGGVLRLPLCQDSTGGATVTWDSKIRWASSTAPTLSGANHCDLITFVATAGTSSPYIMGGYINF